MTQLTMFAPPASPVRAWEKSGGVYGNCGATYTHSSGYVVQHCGHPTANFPYYIIAPDGTGIFAPNGRGFQKLRLAQRHVEDLTKGKRA